MNDTTTTAYMARASRVADRSVQYIFVTDGPDGHHEFASQSGPDNRLSLAASAVQRIRDSHFEAMGYDAGFDAGEFSGPAHYSAMDREIADALYRLGYTPESYDEELVARTSDRFAHFSGLGVSR